MNRLLKAQLIAAGFAIVASCWAPMKDPRKDVKINPEATQSQLEQEQKLQRAQGQVGIVNPNEQETTANPTPTDPQGKADLAAATDRMEHAPKADEAGNPIQGGGPSPAKIGWGLFFVCLGLGSVLGVRAWANKAIPEPARVRKSSW